ncbi:hypothetical protein SAMD00023353_4800500 [Rosellinia necatrix]|uniref:N-acetyltransferase ESCO zinc-finger domain-containing protein n=1 Tax=Rosellinia necatrix TaxID=77044 RepID=A0A1W2TQC1_ROSNE|nr:hypothetical protein SAMD00023353_4800500 [Rosellinia necatrix]
MDLSSSPPKEVSRTTRKTERPYLSSLKASSMETSRRPLRTYSKRQVSCESSEPVPKRQCISSPATSAAKDEKTRAPASDPPNATRNSGLKPPSTPPPIKKGTITAFFKRIPSQPPVASSPSELSSDPTSYPPSDPLSEPNEPTTTPPSSPPTLPTAKRRARRLKTRVAARRIGEDEYTAVGDEEEERENRDENHGRDAERAAVDGVLSETAADTLNRGGGAPADEKPKDRRRPAENKKKKKKKTAAAAAAASVQMTLSLALSEAQYTECADCGMLYNHLHPADVKHHARRHAALRRARARAVGGDVDG